MYKTKTSDIHVFLHHIKRIITSTLCNLSFSYRTRKQHYNTHNSELQQESDSLAVSLKSCKTPVKDIYKPLRIFTHLRPDFVSTFKKRKEKSEDKGREERMKRSWMKESQEGEPHNV